MKTKKLFLMAAMLLTSVCMFAQSNNNEPLKGDVNDDGKVDVADIVAVIEIMKNGGGTAEPSIKYWYVGTTKPTSLSQATIVDEYESPYTFTNTGTSKCDIYVLTNLDKTVIISDDVLSFIQLTTVEDITTIPGYKITQTDGKIAKGSSVIINVLDDGWNHFYVGTTQPTAENYETLTPQYSSLSDMNGATVHVPSSGKIYVMLPYQDSPNQSQMKRAFTDTEGNVVTCIDRSGDEQTIPFHMIWELTFEPGMALTFKEPTTDYWYAGQTAPTSLSSNPTIDDTNFTNNKWHTLGSATQISQTITGGTAGTTWKIAVPTSKSFKAYASDLQNIETSWTKTSTITINNVSYDVWTTASTGAKVNVYMK